MLRVIEPSPVKTAPPSLSVAASHSPSGDWKPTSVLPSNSGCSHPSGTNVGLTGGWRKIGGLMAMVNRMQASRATHPARTTFMWLVIQWCTVEG